MNNHASEVRFELTLPNNPTNLGERTALFDQLRPGIARILAEQPDIQVIHLNAEGTARARRISGTYQPGAQIVFCLPDNNGSIGGAAGASASAKLPFTSLPNPEFGALAERLVGTGKAVAQLLMGKRCLWDGGLEAWGAQTGTQLPPGLRAFIREQTSLTIFCGPPGVGKTTTAKVVADQYCREHDITGRLYSITLKERGSGLINDLPNRVRAAFAVHTTSPPDEFVGFLIDEADAIAVRRSGSEMHHEDRSGTDALLQSLDELRGIRRRAVFMTTNLAAQIDPAVVRRGVVITIERPGPAEREQLLRHWLPETLHCDLARCARASKGMTPADIERALYGLYCAIAASNTFISANDVVRALRSALRTEEV